MIFTIFLKELKETLRDRRTLMMMLVIPILVFPIIINITASVSSSFQEDAATKKIKIGIVDTQNQFLTNELNQIPDSFGKKEIVKYSDTLQLIKDIKNEKIQLGAFVSGRFQAQLDAMVPAPVIFYFNATDLGMQERAQGYMSIIEQKMQVDRFNKLNVSKEKINPIVSEYRNIASDKEMVGKLAGGFLPYIFIAFCFMGCMYPAIDLFTGEKERGTIETLLTTPVPRWQLLFGKMGVVVLSGLLAASAALLGLFLSMETLNGLDNDELLKVVHSILSPSFILFMYCLLIPLTVFFAGVMIPIAVYAKTFKEAQSIITPLNIVMVIPAMVGLFPGVELNVMTACIPVVNIVLSTKELIAGTLDPFLVALSFVVMTALAVLAVFISYRRFDKESNVVI
ncbi:MAG: ABC transporter permease [Flavobacteriia bacterium]|jgi:sodium transport system permease protein